MYRPLAFQELPEDPEHPLVYYASYYASCPSSPVASRHRLKCQEPVERPATSSCCTSSHTVEELNWDAQPCIESWHRPRLVVPPTIWGSAILAPARLRTVSAVAVSKEKWHLVRPDDATCWKGTPSPPGVAPGQVDHGFSVPPTRQSSTTLTAQALPHIVSHASLHRQLDYAVKMSKFRSRMREAGSALPHAQRPPSRLLLSRGGSRAIDSGNTPAVLQQGAAGGGNHSSTGFNWQTRCELRCGRSWGGGTAQTSTVPRTKGLRYKGVPKAVHQQMVLPASSVLRPHQAP